MGHTVDLTGQKFNKLTVLGKAKQQKCGVVVWDCVCECGGKTIVSSAKLKFGNKKTCGCAKQKLVASDGAWLRSDHWLKVNGSRIRANAVRAGVPFGFNSLNEFALYVHSITPDKCPVFGKKLVAGQGQSHDWSPSIDKIVPEKGYVKGNLQVISYLANRMKNSASHKQLEQFAHWVLSSSV